MMPLFIPVASATENYLRYAQTLGAVSSTQWAIRPFGPADLTRLASTASDSLQLAPGERPPHRDGNLRWQVLPADVNAWYNANFPFGWNDGAVWRGRGLTTAIDGGVAARWRWFSLTLNPIAFSAENRKFRLMGSSPNTSPFADSLGGASIDRPQRFGDKMYSRIDPGQSTLRVDALGIGIGVSTANQWLGPMSEWPFVLSNNAPGFPHVFAGSSQPVNIGIGRIHARLFYGKLSQSAYSAASGLAAKRLGSGISASFMPTLFTGLEIGATRMFEMPWPQNGISWLELRRPFEPFLKEHVSADENTDNQLASMFARWVSASSGFEAYGEFGRDDHNANARDAILEPDHTATVGLGLRKAWLGDHGRLTGLRAEIFNMEVSTLFRHRGEGDFYGNGTVLQGHTERGQVLGVGFAAISGTGSMIAYERFMPSGETQSWSLTRMVMREGTATSGNPAPDVEYALATERVRRVASFRVTYGLTAVYEMNRYFTADAGTVMLTTGLRW